MNRVLSNDLTKLTNPAVLLLARNDTKQLLQRIDEYSARLRRNGSIARLASNISDTLTLVSAGVWGASLIGATVLPVILVTAKVATPVGAAYVIGERVRQRIRKRNLPKLKDWYTQVSDHLRDLELRITSYLLNPPASS